MLEFDVWVSKHSHDFCPDRLGAHSEVKRNQPEADSDAQLQSTNNGLLCFHILIFSWFFFIQLT